MKVLSTNGVKSLLLDLEPRIEQPRGELVDVDAASLLRRGEQVRRAIDHLSDR